MKKLFCTLLLLFVVRLYSGGVCVEAWDTDFVLYMGRGARVAFIDKATGSSMQVCGNYTVETVNEIQKQKNKRKR